MPKANKWWCVNIFCPTCDVETTLKQCEYTTAGEIRFTSYCSVCEKNCIWITTGDTLRRMAIQANSRARESPITQSSQQEKEEDDKFLRSFHIKPP